MLLNPTALHDTKPQDGGRRNQEDGRGTGATGLEGAEEIDQFLLLLGGEVIEMFDDPVGFAAVAAMSANGFD